MSDSEANTDQPDGSQPNYPAVPLGEVNPPLSGQVQTQVIAAKRVAALPAAKSATPAAVVFLKAIRRRWLVAITLGSLVAVTVAALIWLFLPPAKYTAYAKLYMPKKPEGVLFVHPEDVGEFMAYQQTQVALMKGRMVLNAALGNPKVVELNLQAVAKNISPVEWLEKEIRVTTPDGPELPRITMANDNPVHLKVLLQAIVDAYMQEVVNKQTAHRQERLDQLKEINTKYQERLKRLVNARNEVAKTVGSGDNKIIALKQEISQKQLLLAQGELVKVDADLRRLELEAKTFQANGNTPVEIPEKLIDAYIDKDLGKEMAIRDQLEARLAQTRSVLDNEQHPRILSLLDDIAAHKKVMALRRKELRPRYKEELLEKSQSDSQSRLVLLNDQIQFHKEFKKLLNTEITRLASESQDLNSRSLDIEGYASDIKLAEAGLARVGGEIDRFTVEMPAPPRVSRMEEVVVIAPDELSRKFNIAGFGAAGGFGAVLLLIGLLEIRSRRIDSFEEVGQELGLQLMGTIPAARKRFGSVVIRSSASHTAEWQSRLVESINSVRTLVLRAAKTDSLRTLMVTSATNGEGKTSLSTHLAASLARAGHKILLLDGDLRKPAAHRVFDMALVPGVSEVLRGEVPWETAIRPTQLDGLSLMPAGEFDSVAIELLARDGIPNLLDVLKPKYDFIVIDSSPLLPVADTLQLAQHVDGVLFSLFHEVSRLPLVYAACQRLNMVGVRMLGAVINGTHDEDSGYGRGYGYGYIKNPSNETKN